MKGACQGLLHIDMLPFCHRHHHGGKVGEVGSGDGHRLNLVAHLVEHFPEVLESFRIGEFGKGLLCMFSPQIHITESHHVGQSRLVEIVDDFPSPVSDADMGQVHLLVGTVHPVVTGCTNSRVNSTQRQSGGGEGCTSQKISSCCHAI